MCVVLFLYFTVPDGVGCITIPDYSLCRRRDRLGKSGGGIVVYFQEGIAVDRDPGRDRNNFELVWFTVSNSPFPEVTHRCCVQNS